MIFTKAFKFRLCPKSEQESLCAQFAGGARWVYNRALHQRNKLWEEQKHSISLFDQNKELVLLKNQEETSWLSEIHSQVLQQALHDLNKAFQHFFRRVTEKKEAPGYPNFRCKGEHDSFRYPQGVKIEKNFVWLPKIGWVKFRKSREIEGKIKQTTIIKEGKYWYVSFTCEIENPTPTPTIAKNIVGIDLGLEHFATIATNEGIIEIKGVHFLKKSLNKIKYLNRQLSHKKKQSKNRLKAKQALSQQHCKIKNKRKDWQHKLSTNLVKSHDKIVVESLAVQELLENEPRYRARQISDAGWREFLQMLKYKCEQRGKELLAVGRFFPSTKQCFRCKTRNEISLEQREYTCSCGHRMHRDHNAALNLRAAGMSV